MAKLQQKSVKLGLEKILTEQLDALKSLRVGLVCNQASVNHQFQHAADLFQENRRINLVKLFGPQHGIRGDVQELGDLARREAADDLLYDVALPLVGHRHAR